MLPKRLSVVYISPNFPYPRNGFELVELEELASQVNLYVVSLRRPSQDGWNWLTNRLPFRPGHDYAAFGLLKLIYGISSLCVSVFAGGESSRMLRRAFQMDLRGGIKTAIALLAGGYVARIAREFKADVIHADFASATATTAMTASEQTGIPFSFCGHAFDIFSSKPAGKATEPLLKQKALAARAIFAANSGVYLRLQSLIGDTAKLHLKRNGIRGPILPPKDARSRRPFRVVGLGGLVEKKGFDILIEAVAQLASKGEDLELAIYGEGPERTRLEDLGKRLGVPLKLPGTYRHAELEQILDQAAVVVLPSRILRDKDSDGVPTVFIEALRCGVPVIGAAVGSVGDIIRDGETGWLVRSNDVEDLVRALSECIHDYPRACELCRQGQNLVVAEFRAADSADEMVRVWTQLATG